MAKPLYIKLRSGRITQSKQLIKDPLVIFDYNEKLTLIGIEIHGYKELRLDGKKQ